VETKGEIVSRKSVLNDYKLKQSTKDAIKKTETSLQRHIDAIERDGCRRQAFAVVPVVFENQLNAVSIEIDSVKNGQVIVKGIDAPDWFDRGITQFDLDLVVDMYSFVNWERRGGFLFSRYYQELKWFQQDVIQSRVKYNLERDESCEWFHVFDPTWFSYRSRVHSLDELKRKRKSTSPVYPHDSRPFAVELMNALEYSFMVGDLGTINSFLSRDLLAQCEHIILLGCAAYNPNADVLRLLYESLADTGLLKKEYKKNELTGLVRNSSIESLEWLHYYGINLNVQDGRKQNLLFAAPSEKIYHSLVNLGVDSLIRDDRGQTALEYILEDADNPFQKVLAKRLNLKPTEDPSVTPQELFDLVMDEVPDADPKSAEAQSLLADRTPKRNAYPVSHLY
jgi:hypothetical protein